jgi:hypothetical protein
VDAPAQQVEPDLIAGGAAERTGGENGQPEQLPVDRICRDLAVVDFAFDDGEDVDGQILEHNLEVSSLKSRVSSPETWRLGSNRQAAGLRLQT